jgi:hypothetical protein
MSRDGSIDLDFADGTYHFRLAWGELSKLQEACNAGPYVVLDRLISGRWRVEDIGEVVRLGLIGGGLEPVKALKLVREYVQDRPPLESLVLAQRVLGAAVVGVAEEEVGKKSAAADREGSESPISPMDGSGLPPSTATAP